MAVCVSLLTYGFAAADATRGEAGAVALPDDATPSKIAWLAEQSLDPGGAGSAVVIRSDRASEESVRTLETLRSAMFASRLGIHPTPLPPLAASVLAGLAAALVPHVSSAGALLAILPRLERELTVLAWVDSVSGLDHPLPSLGQSAFSMLPGSSFGVSLIPEPVVRRLTRKDLEVPVPEPREDTRVLVCGRAANPEWVKRFAEPAFAATGAALVDAEATAELAPAWWGTKRVVEVVAYPSDLPALSRRLLRGLSASSCAWCGETVAVPVCPFCRQLRPALRAESGEAA